MKKFNKGFTLIELLVVVALIGMLAAIVLASLGASKDKGIDTAIRSTMTNMKNQAELYHANNNGNYGLVTSTAYSSVCPTSAVAVSTGGLMGDPAPGGLLSLNIGLVNRAGSANTLCTVTVGGTAWAASAVLKEPATVTTYCIDSIGSVKKRVGILANSIVASVCQP